MTCLNCPDEAVFLVSDPGAEPVYYCRSCLPAHLQVRANLGAFQIPPPPPPPAPPKKTKKA